MLAALKLPSTRRTVHRYVAAPGVSSSLTSLPSIRSSPSPERRGHSTSPSRFYRRDEHARLHHSINLPVLGCVWPTLPSFLEPYTLLLMVMRRCTVLLPGSSSAPALRL